jgi:hypothetical protein
VQWIRIMSVTMTAHAGGVQGLHSHRDKEGHRFRQLKLRCKTCSDGQLKGQGERFSTRERGFEPRQMHSER